jgi:Tfp pilus assembly protein PilX
MGVELVMNNNGFNLPINLSHQEGAVLIVSLILLVVMTMLGISGMEATKLETRMAANVHDYNQAFQNAEAGFAWMFNVCEEYKNRDPDGFEQMLKQSENWGSVPCATADNNIISPPKNTTQEITGSIKVGADGSMGEYVLLTRSTGSSGDFDNPETIRVTLVGGMKGSNAKDPTVFEQGPECRQKNSQLNCISEANWDSEAEVDETQLLNLLENCAEKINFIITAMGRNSKCKEYEERFDLKYWINEACKQFNSNNLQVENCSSVLDEHYKKEVKEDENQKAKDEDPTATN